jgi:hypothetical protein
MTQRLLNTQKIVNLSADPATGSAGEIYYNTAISALKYHNGTTWVEFGSGGGGVTISDTAPSSPAAGDLWFNSSNAVMYIYYDSFWVEFNGSGSSVPISTDVILSNTWWLGV